MWARIYSIIGGVALFGYGLTTLAGEELFTLSAETPAQAAQRHATGGHRSHSSSFFWFFRGGK
jgi:hypothetical protein